MYLPYERFNISSTIKNMPVPRLGCCFTKTKVKENFALLYSVGFSLKEDNGPGETNEKLQNDEVIRIVNTYKRVVPDLSQYLLTLLDRAV